jgi:hypothetical protein
MEAHATTRFDLIGNALDSFLHAVKHLTGREGDNKGPGDLKRAVRDTVHAIELLLKERLRRVHPAFIWVKVDDYGKDANTVGMDDALKRLTALEGIALTDEQAQVVRSARHLRNQIEHFEFEISAEKAKIVVGSLLSFVFEFADEHLPPGDDPRLDLVGQLRRNELWKDLRQVTDYFAVHARRVNERLRKEGRTILTCRSCSAETFSDEEGKCRLCGETGGERISCQECGQPLWERLATFLDAEGKPALFLAERMRALCAVCASRPMLRGG